MMSRGAYNTLYKEMKFTSHTIHYHGNERSSREFQTALMQRIVALRAQTNGLKLRDRFELIHYLPDLRSVDRQPLFRTFCARAQNISKPCQRAGKKLNSH